MAGDTGQDGGDQWQGHCDLPQCADGSRGSADEEGAGDECEAAGVDLVSDEGAGGGDGQEAGCAEGGVYEEEGGGGEVRGEGSYGLWVMGYGAGVQNEK